MESLKSSFLFIINNILRIVEKIPGINLNQIIFIDDSIIVLTPKAGTRTIRNAVLKKYNLRRPYEWTKFRYVSRKGLSKLTKKYKTYIVYRDFEARLRSCWKQKISSQRDSGLFYFWNYFPLLYPDMEYLDFCKKIQKIPDFLREKHFRSYFSSIDFNNSNIFWIEIDKLDAFIEDMFYFSVPAANKTFKKGNLVNKEKVNFDKKLLNERKLIVSDER